MLFGYDRSLMKVTKEKLPEKSQKEAEISEFLQETLSDLSEDQMEYATLSIINSIYWKSPARLTQLIQNILKFCNIRSSNIELYVKLCIELSNTPCSYSFKNYLLEEIIIEFNESSLYFVRCCIKNELFSFNKVKEKIFKDTINSPNDFATNWKCLCMFSDEIKNYNPNFFDNLTDLEYCSSHERDFLKHIKKQDWSQFKEKIDIGFNPDLCACAIRKDNVDELTSENKTFDYDRRVRPSVYEREPTLQNNPTLIQVAAYYGSIKCFKYLLLNRANLLFTDFANNDIMFFAIAGGNIEILRLLEQNKINFSNDGIYAIKFHRYALFDWLITQKKIDLSTDSTNYINESYLSNNTHALRRCYEEKIFRYSCDIISHLIDKRCIDAFRFLYTLGKISDDLNDLVFDAIKADSMAIVFFLIRVHGVNMNARKEYVNVILLFLRLFFMKLQNKVKLKQLNI